MREECIQEMQPADESCASSCVACHDLLLLLAVVTASSLALISDDGANSR